MAVTLAAVTAAAAAASAVFAAVMEGPACTTYLPNKSGQKVLNNDSDNKCSALEFELMSRSVYGTR
jgi:hypothetical protein